MNVISKFKYIRIFIKNYRQLLNNNNKYIFLISHMRSYSSLLAHILGSHNEILGYFESGFSFNKEIDLLKLRIKLAGEGKITRYYLDKILGNNCRIEDSIFKLNVKPIFFIRKPESTIQSIINMGNNLVYDKKYTNPERMTEYYIQRLKKILHYSQLVGKNGLFFESEKIIADTPKLLDSISSFLDLKTNITSNYNTYNRTGLSGAGDPSGNINKGAIDSKKIKYDIKIDDAYLEKMDNVYNDIVSQIKKNCEYID